MIDQGGWFACRYEPEQGSGEPPIAFRADMDALPIPETIDLPYGSKHPGVAHKCGHDGHTAALAAVALDLEQDKKICRPVCLVFQSAEETGKGGRACAEFLADGGVSEVYAFHNLSGHPEGSILVRDGLTQPASVGLAVWFCGLEAHAGTPENGRNPAGALARMALAAEEMGHAAGSSRLMLSTIVSIKEGQRDFGISPGTGEICFTLRAGDEEDLAWMEQTLKDKAQELGQEGGFAVSFSEEDPFPATVNDVRCSGRVRAAAQALGIPLAPLPSPWRPSEDFGWYAKAMPGALFYIGNGEAWPAPHQPDYDFNDRILPVAQSIFLKLAEGKAL